MSYKIQDLIYGECEFQSSVFKELIESIPVQRLKKINQTGLPNEISYRNDHSRFEHSIGVLLALKRLGASEEEQIAGLLHDISHRAFSHIYDWVVNDYSREMVNNEEAQDKSHKGYIRNSEIPSILDKYGYEADKISNLVAFRLLDTEIPDLCADRIDYSLRQLDLDKARKIFDGLVVIDRKIVCKNQEIAGEFAREFLKLQATMWAGYESAARYHFLAFALKTALDTKIISMNDFWTDDLYVLNKLQKSGNSKILGILKVLREKVMPKPKDGMRVYKKFRHIDPLFVQKDGKLMRLSKFDPDFKKLLDKQRQANSEGILVPEIDPS